jgi:hypothetical protein
MKTGLPKRLPQRKLLGKKFYVWLMAALASAITLVAYYQSLKPVLSREESAQDVEDFIRSKATAEQVANGLESVLVYHKYDGTNHEEFCCIGTVMIDKDYGPVVITAEHVFMTDINKSQIVGFRPLRKSIHAPEYYLNKIVKSSRDLKGCDVVVATFGLDPVLLSPFSGYNLDESNKLYFADVVVGGKKISSVRSLVSGETVPTIGYSRRGDGDKGQVFILIEYHCEPGESCTCFIDTYGGLWFVHAAPMPEVEKRICDDYRSLTHKDIKGVTTLSGPLGGNYD